MAPSGAGDAAQRDAQGADADDTELLRRHAAGEAAAFARLYDRHDARCLDFVRRLLGGDDAAAAEDLAQEAWLAVSRHAAGFDERRARFVTWLFTIARNKVMDHFRARSGVVRLSGDLGEAAQAALAEVADGNAPTPEQVAQNRQLAEALQREVQALPFVQREAFVLFAQHGLALDEVAQVTKVGVETAKSRLRYARQTLRQRLAAWRSDHA